MPDGDHEVSQARSVAAMGERVARVETKIEGIEKDTGVIRSTMHIFAGEMQKYVLQETRCVTALEIIVEQNKVLPELVAKIHSLDEIMPGIRMLLSESHERKGAWGAYAVVAMLVAGAITILGTLGAGAAWIITRISEHWR